MILVPAFELGITVSIVLCFSGSKYLPHFELLGGGSFGYALGAGLIAIN